jgi:hypothetical protein
VIEPIGKDPNIFSTAEKSITAIEIRIPIPKILIIIKINPNI